MSIGCRGEFTDQPLPLCTPECARWYKVNQGESIKVYQDVSGWDPNYYSQMVESPQTHIQRALDIWNDAYPCGTLFELVTDPALADVVQVYPTEVTTNGLNGSVTSVVDQDGEECILQVDEGQTFGPGQPMFMQMYCSQGLEQSGQATDDRYVNIFVHEFGHVLGMNHLSDGSTPPMSIMVNTGVQAGGAGLYGFDVDQLLRRYPCGCVLTSNLAQPIEYNLPIVSSETLCPCCQGFGIY